jgi:hypothetical protein
MNIMGKLKSHNSTYDGDGNRQKGASIFFSDKYWTENECLYKSDNGDIIISKLQNTNIAMIACNVYAPKNHSATYFENMRDLILDIQARNPNHTIIIMEDFNITLENRDNANRNVNIHETNARTIIKSLMFDTNTKDC